MKIKRKYAQNDNKISNIINNSTEMSNNPPTRIILNESEFQFPLVQDDNSNKSLSSCSLVSSPSSNSSSTKNDNNITKVKILKPSKDWAKKLKQNSIRLNENLASSTDEHYKRPKSALISSTTDSSELNKHLHLKNRRHHQQNLPLSSIHTNHHHITKSLDAKLCKRRKSSKRGLGAFYLVKNDVNFLLLRRRRTLFRRLKYDSTTPPTPTTTSLQPLTQATAAEITVTQECEQGKERKLDQDLKKSNGDDHEDRIYRIRKNHRFSASLHQNLNKHFSSPPPSPLPLPLQQTLPQTPILARQKAYTSLESFPNQVKPKKNIKTNDKLKSLTNILLYLKLNHSLHDIDIKLKQLNYYLNLTNQQRSSDLNKKPTRKNTTTNNIDNNALNFYELKNLLVTNLSESTRKLLFNNSHYLKEILAFQSSDMINNDNNNTTSSNKILTNEENDKVNANKMTILSEEIRLYTCKSTDDVTNNSMVSKLITNTNNTTINNNNMTKSSVLSNDDNFSDTTKSLLAADSTKFSFVSEPAEIKLEHKYDDLGLYYNDEARLVFNGYLIENSPTLKYLFSNLLQSQSMVANDANSCSELMSLEDLVCVYKCTQLAFKRSFSCSKLQLTQRYIKKSKSFEKFLKNVVNGKKKSTSLCINQHQNKTTNNNNMIPINNNTNNNGLNGENGNNNNISSIFALRPAAENSSACDLGVGVISSSLKSISSISIKNSSSPSSSSSSSNLANALVVSDAATKPDQLNDNNNNNTNNKKGGADSWPLLKIDDSLRESTNDLENTIELNKNVNTLVTNLESDLSKLDKDLQENSDINYIPTSIRDALESAGINIEEIINMKNHLEMSFSNTTSAPNNNSSPFEITELTKSSKTTTKKMISSKVDLISNEDLSNSSVNQSIENQLGALIDNMKSLDSTNIKNNQQQQQPQPSQQQQKPTTAPVIFELQTSVEKKPTSGETPTTTTTTTSNQLVSISNLKSLEIKQNLSAKVSEQVENMNNSGVRKPSNRKKSSSSHNRYATVCNFTSPQETIAITSRLPMSPSWTNSEFELTSGTTATLPSSPSLSCRQQIVPPKILTQFKPIVNIHKRTCTTPVANLNQLINSTSTDSFLNLVGYSSSESNSPQQIPGSQHREHKSKVLDKQQQQESVPENTDECTITPADLTKSLPNRNKKKATVSRSFSYNIGKIIESSNRMLEQQRLENELAKKNLNAGGKVPSTTTPTTTPTKTTSPTTEADSSPKLVKEKQVAKKSQKSQNAKVVGKSNTVQLGVPLIAMGVIQKIDTKLGSSVKENGLMSAPVSQTGLNGDLQFSSSSLIDEATSKEDFIHAKRKAIVVQMYDTEKSYVEALKILVQKYYLPLKEKDIVERNLINDIFYKIPEIHVHHELLLSSLKSKYDVWDVRQTIGDILLNIFAKQSVVETYISFVNNYRTSQEAIRICREQSSLFSKFVEQQAKDHRGKLTLKDLIIQPVQRIPRYELYIKDFLKCTPANHPDYQLLMKAQKEVHNLAEKIDQVHKEVNETYSLDSQSVLQTIQDLIENLDDLVTAYRYYIRHDTVTIISSTGMKKDRCIFLFSDLIILTSCKRRSTNVSKKINSIILNSPIGKQYLENIKHKLVMKFQLEDIDLTGINLFKKMSFDKDFLEEDLNTITRINELVRNIVYPHQTLDESLKDITASILRQLNESSTQPNLNPINISTSSAHLNTIAGQTSSTNNSESSDVKNNQLVLSINTTERVETMTVVYTNPEHRLSWEKCFIDAKKIFFESFSRKPATFLSAIAIPKNRSGVQFTCASARLFLSHDQNDVWICSTDGQMGQVCIMNTIPELTVTSCNTVCSARITCIQCVPPLQIKRSSFYKKSKNKNFTESLEISDNARNENPNMVMLSQRQESIIDFDSSEEDDKESQSDYEEKDTSTITTSSQTLQSNFVDMHSIPTLSTNSYQEIKHSTMWIGNDDGSLHIFQFNDSTVRTVARKNRITKQFSSGIQSLAYMDNKVFVSLKNGDIVLFKRVYSIWNYDSFSIKTVSHSSFNCMLNVAGKLWCTCNNSIKVLNPSSLECDHTFTIDGEKGLSLAAGGNCTWAVWIACLNNLDLKLYHATKYVILAEINIKQCISQTLNGCEELIRLHKVSCIKITSLYVCKDTLWVGTSAGIIVNVKIPYINNATSKLNIPLSYNVLNHGHVGPVRFITSVDIPKQSSLHQLNEVGLAKDTLITSPTSNTTTSLYRTVVISGGEGYDEYKSLSTMTSGISLSNSGTSNVNTQTNQQINMADIQSGILNSSGSPSNTSNIISNSPISTSMQLISTSMSSNLDENNVGKEDLVNYVLTWEL